MEKILELDFGQAELVLAVSKDFCKEQLFSQAVEDRHFLSKNHQTFCEAQGIDADIIDMSGAVELAPKVGT